MKRNARQNDRDAQRGAAILEVTLLVGLIAMVCIASTRATGVAAACTLSQSAAAITGNVVKFDASSDLNGDKCVDFNDFLVLQNGFGSTYNFNDFLKLQNAFGSCAC